MKRVSRIVLIGFPSAGKTSCAPLLAKALSWNHIDLDHQVEALDPSGFSCREIYLKHGEKAFREAEYQAAKHIEKQELLIVSTGGGAVLSTKTMDALNSSALFVHLELPIDGVRKESVPVFMKSKELLQQFYEERYPLYESYSNIKVSVHNKNLETLIQNILTKAAQNGFEFLRSHIQSH